jgi:hypothetical protein
MVEMASAAGLTSTAYALGTSGSFLLRHTGATGATNLTEANLTNTSVIRFSISYPIA